MTNPSYTDEQVRIAAAIRFEPGFEEVGAVINSLLADRQRLQAEVEALRLVTDIVRVIPSAMIGGFKYVKLEDLVDAQSRVSVSGRKVNSSLEKRMHRQLLDMLGARDQAHAAGIIAGLHAAEQKAALLKWAEDHPEAAMQSMETMWRAAGRGFREEWFNFSGAIEIAQDENKEAGHGDDA